MEGRYYNKKPILVIYFPEGAKNAYPFTVEAYKESYYDFAKLASKIFSVFMCRGRKHYAGSGIFKTGFYFNGEDFILHNQKIAAKVIFDKSMLNVSGGKDWGVLNTAAFNKLCNDKYKTYLLFKEHFKFTCKFKNISQAKKCLKSIKTSNVVYKPNNLFGGKGVMVLTKQQAEKKLGSFKEGIFQEFVDTSGGIPGVVSSVHDLRVVVINGKIVQSFVRIPKGNSLISNVARGGIKHYIHLNSIPHKIILIVKDLDDKLKKFNPRFYAVDFGVEKDNPFIFEINHAPALPTKGNLYYHAYHEELLNALTKVVKKI